MGQEWGTALALALMTVSNTRHECALIATTQKAYIINYSYMYGIYIYVHFGIYTSNRPFRELLN